MQYVIDTTIPAPDARSKYPFADLKPGESVFLPGVKSRSKEYRAAQRVADYYKRKFALRVSPEGLRVWRLE